MGVLVGDREILTCAHVVNKALGRDLTDTRRPGGSDVIRVEFPLLSDMDWHGQAYVRLWLPPPRDDAIGDDIAGLILTGERPEGTGPARLARGVPPPHQIVDVFGYPRARPHGGFVEAVVRYEVGGGLLQLDSTTGSALRIQPGYSGSPVCDRHTGQVVGLLWMAPRADAGERDSYAITADRLRSAWPDVLAHVDRDIGQVTADMFVNDWPLLARDVQEHESFLPQEVVGREWLMAEIDAFCHQRDRGYFLIEGDAGMGKTTFAAWLARQKRCAVHFAQADPDSGITVVAVRSLGAQLIAAWNLLELAPGGALPRDAGSAGWFRAVLRGAARHRDHVAPGMPIVLVVDALDAAAEHPVGHLPLGLPDRLPGGVYVVATARTGGLRHAAQQEEEYAGRGLDGAHDENLADLRRYLVRAVDERSVAKAIASAGIGVEQFTDVLVERSLGVWVYVRYVLEEIKRDPRRARELPGLPRGLEAYYHNNLARLCDGPDGSSLYMPLLATLAVAAEPVEVSTLAALARIGDRQRVQQILDHELRPYVSILRLPGEPRRRFRIGHPSLSEYLVGSFDSPAADARELGVSAQSDVSSLREELASACRDAHRRICNRYLEAWGGLDDNLPNLEADPELGGLDGGYALRWLTSHLLAAGREFDLHYLLACGPHGRNIWFAAHDHTGDVAGYLRDVDHARGSAERLGTQLRYVLLQASIASLSTALPPVLVGELVARGQWTAARALSLIERMTDEQRRAQALAGIASCLSEELLGPALGVALRCKGEESLTTALQALIPCLHGDTLERATDALFGIGHSAPDTLLAVAACLPEELLRKLDRNPWNFHPSKYLRAAVTLFGSDDRSGGARRALAQARQLDPDYDRGLLVAALVPYLPSDAFGEVLAVLSEIERSRHVHPALTALAKHCPAERLGDLLDFAGTMFPPPEFFREVAPRLTAEQLLVALRLCQACQDEADRVSVFIELAPYLSADQARDFLARPREGYKPLSGHMWHFVIGEFLQLYDQRHEFPVVGMLLERLPEPEASAKLTELIISKRLRNPVRQRADLFSRWLEVKSPLMPAMRAKYLSGDRRQESVRGICQGIRDFSGDAEETAFLLAQFVPFSLEEIAEIFDIMKTAWWPGADLIVADVLAPYLHDERLLLYTASRVRQFPLEEECFTALAELAAFQTATARNEIAEQALAIAADISYSGKKAHAIAALAPILLHPDLVAKAFEIARPTGPYWMPRAVDPMAPALPADLLQEIVDVTWERNHPALVIPRILKRLATDGYTNVIDSLLPGQEGSWNPHGREEILSPLAPLISPLQARRLWDTWDRENSGPYDAEALSALVGRLPEHERAVAVDEVLAIYAPGSGPDYRREARTLGRLARAASSRGPVVARPMEPRSG